MKRRDFLKYSSLVLPATAAMGMINPFTRKVFAAGKKNDSFSLSVITDQPSRTIHTIEQAIKNTEYGKNTLQFTEYRLKGRHIGDIAYVKSQALIDYHKGIDELSLLLRFSSEQSMLEANDINILRGNTLIKQLPLSKDIDHYQVEGLKGHVAIKIENKSVRITSATCKHKTCMNMEPISKPGENLICIPNQINIAIAGKSFLGVDSITY